MRSKAVFLVLIFFASLFGGFVQGQTPEDITVDGDYTDWSSDSLMATDSSGVDFSNQIITIIQIGNIS